VDPTCSRAWKPGWPSTSTRGPEARNNSNRGWLELRSRHQKKVLLGVAVSGAWIAVFTSLGGITSSSPSKPCRNLRLFFLTMSGEPDWDRLPARVEEAWSLASSGRLREWQSWGRDRRLYTHPRLRRPTPYVWPGRRPAVLLSKGAEQASGFRAETGLVPGTVLRRRMGERRTRPINDRKRGCYARIQDPSRAKILCKPLRVTVRLWDRAH